jgi:hypothetical protein
MNRRFGIWGAIAASLVVLGGTLAACDDDTDSTKAPASPTTDAAQDSTTADAGHDSATNGDSAVDSGNDSAQEQDTGSDSSSEDAAADAPADADDAG